MQSQDQLIGLRLSRLSTGDSVDLSSLRVAPAAWKTALTGRETADTAATSKNIFDEETFQFDKVSNFFSPQLVSTRVCRLCGLSLRIWVWVCMYIRVAHIFVQI